LAVGKEEITPSHCEACQAIMDKKTAYLFTIKETCPNLDVNSARLHTTEGQFNDILFINDDLIFRFPRYEESIQNFLREIKLLQILQGYVSLPVPNPIYISAGTSVVGKVFMGYKMLPGKPLFRNVLSGITDKSILETFAQQLANFLHGLHTFSPTELGLDLPHQEQLTEYRPFFSDIKEHLFAFMRPDARDSINEHFENYFDNPSLHEYTPSIIHGDFGGSNILFEENKITGIIDFGFAGLSDPARDIASVSTFGDPFFARICRHYPNIESLLERANFYRGTYALYEALHGFRNNDKEAFESGMEQYL
jgi:aminoglycoside 2''-phosphotransferase